MHFGSENNKGIYVNVGIFSVNQYLDEKSKRSGRITDLRSPLIRLFANLAGDSLWHVYDNRAR